MCSFIKKQSIEYFYLYRLVSILKKVSCYPLLPICFALESKGIAAVL
jgi:hypothetical protein